jgi:RNA polymerase sigma-70 factor, ECF subfamily
MTLSEPEVLQALMHARVRLSAAAWLVVRDTHTAEDIFQNVAVKALTRDLSFESESALLSWAFITARHEGIDWLRRHRRETSCVDTEIMELLEREWQSESVHSEGSKVNALRECLESVPEESRRLLRLRYFDGHNCNDVARRMGIGLNAIYKRVSRLHESLRLCIEGKLGHAGSNLKTEEP